MKGVSSLSLLAAASVVLAACATVPSEQSEQQGPQQQLASEAHDYRAQSYTLWDMADRRRAEADILSQQLGRDHAEVQMKLRLAEELTRAAEEADRQARGTRQQVPHGMMQ
jgi:hypothetical protein